MSHCPVHDETYSMCSKKNHRKMTKPDMILDTRLRGKSNKRQNWRSSSYRKEEKSPAYVSNISKSQRYSAKLCLPPAIIDEKKHLSESILKKTFYRMKEWEVFMRNWFQLSGNEQKDERDICLTLSPLVYVCGDDQNWHTRSFQETRSRVQ